ncbi:MAG: response regulator transcription factor [Clostridia bacterium]|nr:response regulator transcription factor [Clostridia bacterium]
MRARCAGHGRLSGGQGRQRPKGVSACGVDGRYRMHACMRFEPRRQADGDLVGGNRYLKRGEVMAIRVLIAEDSESIRKWYQYALGSITDIELLPMAKSGYEAVAFFAMHQPDVLILDMEMESRDAGLQAGHQVLTMKPDTKIIVLTVYDDDATIFRTYEMGAVDYLSKKATPEEIAQAIRDAYHGTSPIRQEIAQRMRDEFRRLKQGEDALMRAIMLAAQLSPTESGIVAMLANGISRKAICEQRFIEMSTLKSHIRNILQKMKVRNTEDLIALVERENLLPYLQTGEEPDNAEGKS